MPVPRHARRERCVWFALGGALQRVLLFLAVAFAPARADLVRDFDLPEGDAAATLIEFSHQSGTQLIFPFELSRGIRTHAVAGAHAPAGALRLMLVDTGLEAVLDPLSGAFAIRRSRPASVRGLSPRREPPAPDEAGEPVEMETFRVSRRRDAGLIHQSILRQDAEAPIYHQVISRRQIEALGVTSMAELMTMVPGYSGEGMENLQSTVGLGFDQTGTVVYSGAFLKLRGFDSARTAVLLNGRRLPISVDSRGPDLSRIPLAAVERLDVLPFSGSALYGENVVGGAVNIVLRKDYAGRSLSWMFGTSTDGGGEECSVTAVQGITLGDGRTRATLIVDYQNRSALRMNDRELLERGFARTPLEQAWERLRSRQGLTGDDLRYYLSASPVSPGVLVSAADPGGLGLPGAPEQTWVVLPTGQDGTGLTPASFDPHPQLDGLEHRESRLILRRPSEVFSVTGQLEHTLAPDRLELYGEFGYSRAEDRFDSPHLVSGLRLSETDPRNPFAAGVAPGFAGRAVYLFFDPADLPDNRYEQFRQGGRAVLGLRGKLERGWSWTVDGSFDGTQTRTLIDSPNIPLNALLDASRMYWSMNELGRIYNPFADHRAFPIPSATVDGYFRHHAVNVSDARVYGLNARLYGAAAALPAGPLDVSLRTEYRREENDTEAGVDFSPGIYRLTGTLGEMEQRSAPRRVSDDFDYASVSAEAAAPLVGGSSRPLPLHRAELDWAARLDRTFEGRGRLMQTVALKVEPTDWLGFRGCFSQGYMPPPVSAVRGAVVETASNQVLADPRSPGAAVSNFVVVTGGDPSLSAETSNSSVVGVVLKPPAFPGLLLTVDAWQIHARNGLRVLYLQEILDRPEFFGERVTRGGLDALGREAPPEAVTRIDDRPVNLASVRSSGIDWSATWSRAWPGFGRLEASAAGTWVGCYEEQLISSEPAENLLGRVLFRYRDWSAASPLLPLRSRLMASWERGRVRIGIVATHASGYRVLTPVVPSAGGYGPGLPATEQRVDASTLWDVQLSYAAPRRLLGRLGGLAGQTTFTFGVRNVFDRAPSFRADGVSFYSRFEDPRMRFVYLRVRHDW